MKRIKLLLGVAIGIMFWGWMGIQTKADEETPKEVIPIYFYEDLENIVKNPSADYILMQDIDMYGKNWTPIDFSGSFNGNDHALLNLYVDSVSEGVRTTYDGNMKTYDTHFAGLFGCLENATVENLNLVGAKIDVESVGDCFIGTVAGYSDKSTIQNCTISGEADLHVNGAMFGVGGVVGFGNGAILNTVADTTLVCVDLDASTRDEQFMGGAYAAGFLDLDGCKIQVRGFDSDHGYVHDGGLVGMYALYPVGTEYAGYITNTDVSGKISFFEDNTNRRAYCSEICGEVLHWTYAFSGCHASFERDETFDYSKDLYPHDSNCTGTFTEEVISGDCENYGHILYTCDTCGYQYRDCYALKPHLFQEPEVIQEATVDSQGVDCYTCSLCSDKMYAHSEKLEPVVDEVSAEELLGNMEEANESEENTNAGNISEKRGFDTVTAVLIIFIAGGVAIVLVIVIEQMKRKNRRKHHD